MKKCLLSLLILLFNSCGLLDAEKYQLHVQEYRAHKNNQFKHLNSSPIPDEKKTNFSGLNYFDINPNLNLIATLSPQERIEFSVFQNTNSQEEEVYQKAGEITFVIDKKSYHLAAYIPKGEDLSRLFIPFTDAGANKSTYAGGRYLYALRKSDNQYILDFNYTHNPYCAYNPNYSCPLPPKENQLSILIEAGEKIYAK